MKVDSRFLRDRGYEALFLLGGFLALSLRPTLRQAIELEAEIGDILLRRREFRQLEQRGLVEAGAAGTGGIVRLTALGREVFNGGRLPDEAWSRGWDGEWRLLLFDLPRDARATRAKFWRWLRANHFGQFQASAWITPDPVPEICDTAAETGLDDAMFAVFTGQLGGRNRQGRDVAAAAWNFDAINKRYGNYVQFAKRQLDGIKRLAPSSPRLKAILREDRKEWWRAVQPDPLLPDPLLPKEYAGKGAWKLRQQLLARLLRSVDPAALRS